MTKLGRTFALCLAVAVGGCSCSVWVRHSPRAAVNEFRETPPRTVAILPFENFSQEPLAGGAARDALFYALTERGFELLPLPKVDALLQDPEKEASLLRPDGQTDPQLVGEALNVDAVAYGRVVQFKQSDSWLGAVTRIKAEVGLVRSATGAALWTDRANAYVRVFDRLRDADAATPAEKQQARVIRLCRSFDRFWWRLRKSIPSVAQSSGASPAKINKIMVQPTRPVVSAGDRVDIVAEGTADCIVQARLGTLGREVFLDEARDTAPGVYRGSYSIQPGDLSNYCRVIAVIEAGDASRQEIAPPDSAFVIDTIAPDPPTSLSFETQLDGVELNWNPPRAQDLAHYLVYRSDEITGGVRLLGNPTTNRYVDHTVRGPGRQHYFVKAIDRAGNPSSSSLELVVEMPGQGPSTVGGTINGDARWTAFGGPYRMTEDVDVAPEARLIIEPGTEIEIPPGMEITVRGTVEAIGREDKPIGLTGTETSTGFNVVGAQGQLHAAHVEFNELGTGIKVVTGECHVDQCAFRRNETGIDAVQAGTLEVTNTTFLRNQNGAAVGPKAELRSADFSENEVGLRVVGDGALVDACRFNNIQVDVVKFGNRPLEVDGCTFWTSNAADLYDHLWGNVTCRRIRVRSVIGRGEREVLFEPFAVSESEGDRAAVEFQWEKALAAFKEALLQERDRGVIDKALNMYKQIAATDGLPGMERELAFCRSAVFCYPRDIELLTRSAELHFRTGRGKLGRQVCTQILQIDPDNEYAQKRLEAAGPIN